MTNEEAIKAIKANWPSENYSILREALTLAIRVLGGEEQYGPFEMLEQQVDELQKAADRLLEETKKLREIVSKSWIH